MRRPMVKISAGLLVVFILLILGLQRIEDTVKALDTQMGNGLIVYGVSGNTTGQSRTYDGTTNTFGSQSSTTLSLAGTNYTIRTSPTKQEAIVGYTSTTGILQILCYDGTTWTNEWSTNVGGTALTRRFDIAYETNTGEAVVLFSTNTTATNTLSFRSKPGNTGCGTANWTATTSMATSTVATTAVVGWVKMAESPVSTSTLIAAMWSDATSTLGGAIWDGSTFTNFKKIDTSLDKVTAVQDVDNFDIKYQSLNQDVMTAWGSSSTTNRIRYMRCTGGTSSCTWGASTTMPVVTQTTMAANVVLAANPLSNQMLFSSMSSTTSALQNQYWNGTAWLSSCTGCAAVDTTTALVVAGTKLVSNAWLTSGTTTRGIVAYNDSAATNIGWYLFNGVSTFTVQTDFTVAPVLANPQKWYDLQPDPFTYNRLMFTISDNASDLFSKRLVMGATSTPTLVWTNSDASAALQVNLVSVTASPGQFRYWRWIPLPTFTQIAYRIFNDAASTDVGSALAAQDTAVNLATTGAIFRVRTLILLATNELLLGFKNFKLQFVDKGSGTCAAPSGGTPSSYTDVSTTTVIAYYNGAGTNGVALTANANDPTHGGDAIVNQTFNESNPISNTIATISSLKDGKWDFSLKDNGATASTTYCLRLVGVSTPMYAWGNPLHGVLAQQATSTSIIVSTSTQPIYFPNWNWISVAAGTNFVVAVRNDGTIWGWGESAGAGGSPTGVGDTSIRLLPTQATTTTTWSKVSAGNYGSMAIKSDGSLWVAGDSFYGSLGLSVATTTVINVFTKMATTSVWLMAKPAFYHGVGIQSDGSLWVWGTNHDGQLGLGTATSTANVLPTRLGTNSWVDVKPLGEATVAIRADRTLWVWGGNANGVLAIATTTLNVLSPTQIGTDTDWNSLDKGSGGVCGFMLAIKTNGTLWMWGINTSGQAGNGASSTLQITPAQVGTDTDWQAVMCTVSSVIALKTNGTLWGWGSNLNGQLATGATSSVPTLTPTQIGTDTNWSSVFSGGGTPAIIVTKSTTSNLDTYSSFPQVTTSSGSQSISFAVSTTTVYLGTLSSSATSYGSSTNILGSTSEVTAHTLAVNTNATTGYSLTVQGSTLASTQNSAWTISPLLTNTAPSIGTEQFGIRATASGGTGSVTSPYAASGFAYTATATTSAQIGSDNVGDSATTTFSVRYMVNINALTDASTYTGNFVYVATANF